MNNVEQESNLPLGLDVGTSRIVVARSMDRTNQSQYESQLNAFITMPYSKLAESLLEREGVFHEVFGGELVVTGNDAQRFAEVFHVETRRPMLRGVLNPQEPHSLPVMRSIISRLVGKAGAVGRKIFFSIPAPCPDGDQAIAYHEASIQQILKQLGFEPQPIQEGLAVVFGEMAASNYTGIGISCGSGLCNVCLAVLSVPVINFAVPKAGDFIDVQAAAVTGELATRMRVQKELNFTVNGLSGDRVQNALTVYYDDVIQTLANTLAVHDFLDAAFAETRSIRADRAEWRHDDSEGIPEALHHSSEGGGFPDQDFGNPRGRRPPQFHRPRRADGRTLLDGPAYIFRNGLTTGTPPIAAPCCRSSVYRTVAPAIRAAWTIIASQNEIRESRCNSIAAITSLASNRTTFP